MNDLIHNFVRNFVPNFTLGHTLKLMPKHFSYQNLITVCQTALLVSLLLCSGLVWHPVKAEEISHNAQKANTSPKAPRIISLAPHLTEMVYSAGAGEQLVGVVKYSDYPAGALEKPIIGDFKAINIERIIKLQPDIILVWRSGSRMRDFERLQSLQTSLQFQIIETEIEQLSDIPDLIQKIGQLAGTEENADLTANKLRQQLSHLQHQYRTEQPVSVFYQIWNNPLMTVGANQFISQGIKLCGGQNIFNDIKALSGQVALETILLRNPEVILLGGSDAQQVQWQQTWQDYRLIDAVKHQRIYPLENNVYQRPTQRFIEALPTLCQTLQSKETG